MSVAQDLKRDGINIIGYKPESSKEQRASIASFQIEAGNLLLSRQAPWLSEFQAECLAFPNGRHDDQVDSMSQAIIWSMNRHKVLHGRLRDLLRAKRAGGSPRCPP